MFLPLPWSGRQEGTSLYFYLVRGTSKRPCRKHDLFIWDHEAQRLQDPKQELWREILWPAGELADLGIEPVGQDAWDKGWPKWKRADLELPPRDLAQAATCMGFRNQQSQAVSGGLQGARAKETTAAIGADSAYHWPLKCLCKRAPERKSRPWSSGTARGSPSQTLNLLRPAFGGSRASWVKERGPRSRWGNGEHGLDPSPGRRSSAISSVESFNSCLGLISFTMKKTRLGV